MDTYSIYRVYEDLDKDQELIAEGLTLKEAQAHCSQPDTQGDGWFDGFERE